MNTNDLDRLRFKLEASLQSLRTTAAGAKAEIQSTAENTPSVLQDELDFAKGEMDLKTALEIYDRSVWQQCLMKQALIRMELGTFGICIACGDEIEMRRLEASPAASRCFDCQHRSEYGFAAPAIIPPNVSVVQIRKVA